MSQASARVISTTVQFWPLIRLTLELHPSIDVLEEQGERVLRRFGTRLTTGNNDVFNHNQVLIRKICRPGRCGRKWMQGCQLESTNLRKGFYDVLWAELS